MDSYGAIHYHKCYERDFGEIGHDPNHFDLWPMVTKRWRFNVRHWELTKSVESGAMTQEDYEVVEARMRKILPIPKWVARGDAWEAAGRPQGLEKFEREFERAWARKIRLAKKRKIKK